MDKKKTICVITFTQGGPRVWAENLVKHLKKRGYNTEIYYGRYRQHILKQFKYYDIIHSVMPVPYPLTKKYVLTIHGNYKEENSILAKILYPIMALRADVVTIPSRFLQEKLQIKNIKIIPNGIDLPSDKKTSYIMKGEEPVIGVLTNFNFRPKAEGLIRLAKIIQNISPKIGLVIGGSGKFFEEYKKIILKKHENTKFLGHCDKKELFNQIDIFAYYSMLDNQPLAVLEAMAYGLPVVSNDVGAIREMMTGGLKKYVANNEREYKKILKELINSKEEREFNAKEAIKKSQDFSWEKIVERFIKLYES